MYDTVAEVMARNAEIGDSWFSESTMAFFDSRIESQMVNGLYFVTSEQPPSGVRHFSVRHALDSGKIETVGEFGAYATKADAIAAAKSLAVAYGLG